MVSYCCAYNCKEYYQKGGPLTFHRFPSNPYRRKLWEIKIRRADFKAAKYSVICSKHFTPDSFFPKARKEIGYNRLKLNAIPSIFDFGKKYEKQQASKRGISADEILHEDSSSTAKSEKKPPHCPKEFDETDAMSPTKVQKLLQIPPAEVSSCNPIILKFSRENKGLKNELHLSTSS